MRTRDYGPHALAKVFLRFPSPPRAQALGPDRHGSVDFCRANNPRPKRVWDWLVNPKAWDHKDSLTGSFMATHCPRRGYNNAGVAVRIDDGRNRALRSKRERLHASRLVPYDKAIRRLRCSAGRFFVVRFAARTLVEVGRDAIAAAGRLPSGPTRRCVGQQRRGEQDGDSQADGFHSALLSRFRR
jgi:hypothetical protein